VQPLSQLPFELRAPRVLPALLHAIHCVTSGQRRRFAAAAAVAAAALHGSERMQHSALAVPRFVAVAGIELIMARMMTLRRCDCDSTYAATLDSDNQGGGYFQRVPPLPRQPTMCRCTDHSKPNDVARGEQAHLTCGKQRLIHIGLRVSIRTAKRRARGPQNVFEWTARKSFAQQSMGERT
jgi:hypothetical protein